MADDAVFSQIGRLLCNLYVSAVAEDAELSFGMVSGYKGGNPVLNICYDGSQWLDVDLADTSPAAILAALGKLHAEARDE